MGHESPEIVEMPDSVNERLQKAFTELRELAENAPDNVVIACKTLSDCQTALFCSTVEDGHLINVPSNFLNALIKSLRVKDWLAVEGLVNEGRQCSVAEIQNNHRHEARAS